MDGSSYQDYIECMTEIQGKLILVRVSMGFELSRVDCIFFTIPQFSKICNKTVKKVTKLPETYSILKNWNQDRKYSLLDDKIDV